MGLFLEDWRSLSFARRARGVGDSGRIRRFGGQTFALLVLSMRRASKLATAMEAKDLGTETKRSWARPSPFGWRETILIGVGVAVGAAAVTAAVVADTWRFIFG